MSFSPEYAHGHIITAAEDCPQKILDQQVPLLVTAVNYEGEEYQGVIETNQAIAPVIGEFFFRALNMGFPIPDIAPASTEDFDDLWLQIRNKANSFNYRKIAGTEELSLHSKGRALDVSQAGRRKGEQHAGFGHPYMRRDEKTGLWSSDPEGVRWDPTRPGTLHTNHPLVKFMREKNMIWGGDWKGNVVDYQHFGEDEV
jgi:hypothetical protein